MYKTWSPELITPIKPPEGNVLLEDLALNLSTKSGEFAGKLHPVVCNSIVNLVRSMNCYYSNLIEGHNTHPIDIERALHDDYSKDLEKRNLQLEARAHIETQLLIDQGKLQSPAYTADTIITLHKEFLSKLPKELLIAFNPKTKEEKIVQPGKLRDGDVQIGQHIAPPASKIKTFLGFFEESYAKSNESKIRKIISVPAAHHRLLWIHPFFDGNGRVARLVDHAAFRELKIGNGLWTSARGLARNQVEYRKLLMAADEQRKNATDGKGNLSQSALIDFCAFFLEVCIDQVGFMSDLLEPSALLKRIERYVREKQHNNNLPKGSFRLLQYALIHGEFDRGMAAEITAYKERQARTVLSELVKKQLLISDSPKGKVRLNFCIETSYDWFPRLFPAN